MSENLGFVFKEGSHASHAVIEGFYITIIKKQTENHEILHYDLRLKAGDNLICVRNFIERNLKLCTAGDLLSYTAEDDCITLDFDASASDGGEDFLRRLASFMKELGIKSRCVHCRGTNNLGFYSWGNKVSVLCSSCGEELMETIHKESSLPSNYFTGFLLSLTGALMGAAIWIAIGASGLYASIAGYLIAWAAYRGYKAAKGRLDVRGLIIMGLSVIIAFVAANYIDLFICFKRSLPDMTFGSFVYATPVLFTDKGFMEEWGMDFFLGVTFVLLGSEDAITACIRQKRRAFYADIRKI